MQARLPRGPLVRSAAGRSPGCPRARPPVRGWEILGFEYSDILCLARSTTTGAEGAGGGISSFTVLLTSYTILSLLPLLLSLVKISLFHLHVCLFRRGRRHLAPVVLCKEDMLTNNITSELYVTCYILI